ncbi:hypothetical protein BpHYR1_050655 [Brachionus plicatilis]|uniref:Uncharacterized protein n=1 Tax=Brachionus plicatilis TaxID=10195 RepID=A0A3M7QLG7_BRAPC|nr:hypothetical protein BpHYR1_050655 [Brachionus plicatilis]
MVLIHFSSQTGAFNIKDEYYNVSMVKLNPKASFKCSELADCVHIVGVQLSLGVYRDNSSKKKTCFNKIKDEKKVWKKISR